jgi:hypothetical protein
MTLCTIVATRVPSNARIGAIDDVGAGLAADELVVGGLVGILKPTPPADVQDKDGAENPFRIKGLPGASASLADPSG